MSATTSSSATRRCVRGPRSEPASIAAKARLAYVLLRDVVQVFYETVLFRWPFLQ